MVKSRRKLWWKMILSRNLGLGVATAGVVLSVVACGYTSRTVEAPVAARLVRARAEAPSFKTQVAPVLNQSCVACHSAGRRAPAMFTRDGSADLASVRSNIGDIINAIETGRMPRGNAPKVSPENLSILKAWQAAGTPDN
jgi:uncharacterized membrane protein